VSLTPGSRLGPYEIVAPLGAGGMGEVFRARDTRLQRQVAIKIVPPSVASDPTALARFEREAQAVAALSHPNILAIHDIGRERGISYAMMDLLEGRSLAGILESGPLPSRKALEYGSQIVSGLAAAHERGVVHRDIKPGNLFVGADDRVTILDFGLARMDGPAIADPAGSATMAPGTSPGMVVGTIGYMAPEQVRGQAVDYRTDLFAFGAVLYEMLSGRRAFSGATPADTLSAILNSDPPDVGSVPSVSPALDRIIRRCLEKAPAQRFQSTRDLGFALDALTYRSASSAGTIAAAPARPAMGRLPIAVASLVLGAALAAVAMRAVPASREAPAAAAVMRFSIPAGIGNWVSVSPDGQSLAWSALTPGGGVQEVWVRRLEAQAAFLVPDSRGTVSLSWRDDTRLLAMRNGTVFSIEPESGIATPFVERPREFDSAQFGGFDLRDDGDLLMSMGGTIYRVRPGAAPVELARPDPARHLAYAYPEYLPDGRRMLFVAAGVDKGSLEAFVQPLDGGAPVRLDLPTSITRVLVDPGGSLVLGRGSVLLAQRFDFATLKPLGEPVTLAANAATDRFGALAADVGPSDVLAYRSGAYALQRLDWVDRNGRLLGAAGSPAPYANFDLSPDGRQVVVLRRGGEDSGTLWLLDESRGVETQIADSNGGPIADPTWSHDGRRVAFRRGSTAVVRNVFGGEETVIANFAGYPDSWSRDGRYLALGRPNGSFFELWAVRVDGVSEQIPLVQGLTVADEPRFSPDGRWVAFHAQTGDAAQVYVIPFPPTGERFQISANGGAQPRWRGDGRELFFLDPGGQLMSAEIPGGDPRKAAAARVLFAAGVATSAANDQFTPAPDGQRFLIRRAVGEDQAAVNVILNWRQLLGGR
jgi:Tol biopolymer transport system component